MTGFIRSWAPELASHIQVHSTRWPHWRPGLHSGAYIFSDFERLRSSGLGRMCRLADRVRAAGFPLLNHPARYRRRFDFMRELHANGINDFRVHRIGALEAAIRYPVFLRSEVDHRGSITDPLLDLAQVRQALAQLSWRNQLRRRHLMLVEYCDCRGEDGLFRKFSAMKIGAALIPRHVLFSRNWVTKHPDIVDTSTRDEEIAFLESFPHRAQVEEIFRIAGIDYGRIDYGVRNGRVQVWEINTNPVVVPERERMHPLRLESQGRSARAIAQQLILLSEAGSIGA